MRLIGALLRLKSALMRLIISALANFYAYEHVFPGACEAHDRASEIHKRVYDQSP